MFSTKRNTTPFPSDKPNGDTNRNLIDIKIALARDMSFEKIRFESAAAQMEDMGKVIL